MAEPPNEQRGKGTPTTGKIPVTIATFIKILRKKLEIKLIPNNLEK